ncbi:Lachesin like protein [Argiope bruennichi]|uniref:Lachesin like protein n=1 Tax=Argiope bruennichi TaxID=94029 RepID=A0A8T0E3G5_ARGBR|nr:Lachesin like protein [Argiope bruennichi]
MMRKFHGVLLCLCLTLQHFTRAHPRADLEPEFVGEPTNVTVTEGSTALLTCVVENLGFYRVAWIRVESQTILSIHTHIITRNYRITLDHKNRQNWNLAIASVEESDRGQYMCQINTVPMKKRITYLEVLVPPKFVDRGENEVMAREGTNITLSCKVKGYPPPTVTWEREGGQEISENIGRSTQGEDLHIVKVSRLHMGMYVCTATSSFYQGPAYQPVTRNIMLHVLFPPMIWIPHQLIFASLGDTVSLDCYTEAFPMSINYWTKADSCSILQPSEKYSVSISDNIYQVSMKLVITAVDQEDFGSYKCIAKNSLGSTEGVIRLFEAKVSIYNRKEEVDAEEEEEEKSKDETDTTYRETYEEVRIKGKYASYELMRNTNTKESRLPKSAHLERQRISNFITALNCADCLRDGGAFSRLFIATVWICHYLSSKLMALK